MSASKTCLASRRPPKFLCGRLSFSSLVFQAAAAVAMFTFIYVCMFFFQESRFTPLIPQLRKRDVTTQPLKRRARFQEIGMLSDQELCVFCDHEFLISMATNGKVAQQTVQLGLKGSRGRGAFCLPASDPATTRLSSMQDEARRTDQGMTRRYSVASWDSTCLLCASTCSCRIKDGVSVLQDGGAEGEKLKRT